MCHSHQRIKEITDLLDSISDGDKTIIFCSSVNTVLDVVKVKQQMIHLSPP